jgi:hypothetical protein
MALIDRKIPIITDVNDVPSIEGDPKHPNASLLCKNYNDLIDNELTALNGSIPATTTDLTEGTNLYYTDARFDTRLGIKTTDDLTEGATNKYYATALANTDFDTRLATKTTDNLTEGTTNKYFSGKTTDDLTEGATNKYFADALARLAISVTGNGSYNNATGVINISNATISVDHISLTNTVGNVDTYTVWGDLAETITVGTFTVTNGADGTNGTNGTNGVDGADGQGVVATTVTDNLNGTHTVEFFTDIAKTQKVGEVILNDGVAGADGANGADGISPTVTVLTQSAYDALSPSYDVNTFYVING